MRDQAGLKNESVWFTKTKKKKLHKLVVKKKKLRGTVSRQE